MTSDTLRDPWNHPTYATYLDGLRARARRAATEQVARRRAALNQAQRAASVLRERFGATEVLAFGSLVGSRASDDRSDMDLAVRGIAPERFFQVWLAATEVVDRPLALVDLDDCSARLRSTIQAEGQSP